MGVKVLWQLARPRTLVVIWMHTILGYVIVSGDSPDIYKLAGALIVTLLTYICAVAINDLADEEVDTLNLIHQNQDGDRPIINKTGSRIVVTFIAYATSLFAITLATLINLPFGVFTATMVILNAVYSLPPIQISKRGSLAQLLLPLMYVVFPMYAGLVVSGKSATPEYYWLMLGFYSLFVGRLFLKDIRDETGDKKVGKLTYLVRHGLRNTLYHSGIWSTIGIVIAAYTAINFINLFTTSLVAMVTIGGIINGLMRCYKEKILDTKLLYVAIVGRYASMWTFLIVISLSIARTPLASEKFLILQILTIGIFLSGIVMLHEEIQSKTQTKKPK